MKMAHRRMWRVRLAVAVVAFAASAQVGCSQPAVSVDVKDGGLTWAVDAKPLAPPSGQWLQVCDLAAGDAFIPVTVTGRGGGFVGAAAELKFEGQWKPVGNAMELSCTVSAQPPRDRAIVVRVALPLQAVGWTWWDDIYRKRPIEPNQHYTYVLNWGRLREVSTYPFCALSGPETGVTLAVPLHELRVHRLSYDAGRQALEAEFDLGLSPDAAKVGCRADFHLLVYGHDPKWGFRDAVRRYYEIFPQYAERRVGEGGIWLLSFKPEKMACPWDWGLRFDEGGEHHADYNCAHDILSFVYTEPFGRYERFGKRGTPDGKSRWGEAVFPMTKEDLKKSVMDRANQTVDPQDKRAAQDKEWAQAEVNSAIENQDGTWVWRHWTDIWSSDGTWISNITLNDDPNLPPPSRASCTWKYEIDRGAETARKVGGELGGVYLDSVCGFMGFYNENFRREHWRYTDEPLVASRKAKQPVQLHASTCFALGEQVARRMREQGKFMMGNTGRPEMAWFCPILDMIGTGEHGIGLQADEHYAYMRAYGYHKPLSPMAYDLVKPDKPWEEKERALHRLMFYAVHPGTGGFDDPAKYEPSRPLFRFYEPVICWLDRAGWQPVTRAAAGDPSLLVERYGPGRDDLAGVTFLAARNTGKAPVTAAIELEARALPKEIQEPGRTGEAQPVAWRLVADTPVRIESNGKGGWTVSGVTVGADGTEVIAIGRREAVARLWMRQAQRWLDRLAREAVWMNSTQAAVVRNGDFEQGLSGWSPAAPPNNARAAEITVEEERPLTGKRSVRIQSQGNESRHGLSQGPAVEAGQEYVLRFTYAWARPEGAKGTFLPRFGVKGPDGNWVSDKYVYFRDIEPTGDRPAVFERKFSIPPGHSAGFFQFMFEGNWGTIRIDDVELTSQRIQEAQKRSTTLATDARASADALDRMLAPGAGQDLAALAAGQQATYEKLRDLALALPDGHVQRCLLLPTQNFAESLGRATEVMTGITVHPTGSSWVAGVARCAEATLTCTLHAGASPAEDVRVSVEGGPAPTEGVALSANEERSVDLKIKTAEPSSWGWEDVVVNTLLRCNGRALWLPRRMTLRLHTPVEVEPAGPLGSTRERLPLRVRSWLSSGNLQLSTTARLGDQAFEMAPLKIEPKSGGLQEVEVALPAALVAHLDESAMRGQTCPIAWRAEVQGAAPATGNTEIPLIRGTRCPRLAQTPKVDGRIDPAEWAGAARLQGFVSPQDAKPAPRPTTILLGHDGRRLCIAFLCGGQKQPTAQNRGRDGEVWRDDAVEVFLQPPGREAYYHLAVNAVDSRLDAKCEGNEDRSWDPSWEAKAGAAEDGWCVEMSVPMDALGARAEGIWRGNFGREEADAARATCWSPTFGGFHTPARFGELCF